MTPEAKVEIIMRELDWSGRCPIAIVDQVRFALRDMATWQRERDAKIADSFTSVYEDHKVPGPAHIAACIREWSDETVEKEFAKQETNDGN